MKTTFKKAFFIINSILILFIFQSCREWDDEYDFRNYLRDEHPYSEIERIDLNHWSHQVNDTLKGEIWIYETWRDRHTIKKHCVNCNDKPKNP